MENYSDRLKKGRNSRFINLFLDQLYTMYWCEKYLIAAMERMERMADLDELRASINHHIMESAIQVERLERIFTYLDVSAREKKCKAIQAMIDESSELAKEAAMDSTSRDLGIIIAARKIEHYEMSVYGSMVSLAAKLQNKEVKGLLQETYREEQKTFEKLKELEREVLSWASDE